MNFKSLAAILVSTLALSGAVASTASAQVRVGEDVQDDVQLSDTGTTFYCVNSGGNFATIAERNGRRTAPIFVWRTREFGRDYTPEQRCNLVTERLNNATNQNGGRLRNLLLTTGRVNRLPVVCYVNSDRTGCNSQNLLFTLDSRNATNPDAVLQRLLQFGVTGSGDPIVSFAPGSSSASTPRLRRGYYSLNNAVNQAFSMLDDEEDTPAPIRPAPIRPAPITPAPVRPAPIRPVRPSDGGI